MKNKAKFILAVLTILLGSGATIFVYNYTVNISNTNIENDDLLEKAKQACKLEQVPEKYKDLCNIVDILEP